MQGTADLVLDSCSSVWNGKTAAEITRLVRRKIADFYQRNSMTSYCLALSYRTVLTSEVFCSENTASRKTLEVAIILDRFVVKRQARAIVIGFLVPIYCD